jgi:hypothetical protein
VRIPGTGHDESRTGIASAKGLVLVDEPDPPLRWCRRLTAPADTRPLRPPPQAKPVHEAGDAPDQQISRLGFRNGVLLDHHPPLPSVSKDCRVVNASLSSSWHRATSCRLRRASHLRDSGTRYGNP